LERKRHIGNDIVVIIFVDYDTDPEDAYRSALRDFDPSCMRSHFNHIFALVSYNHLTECYRLIMYSAESVPEFGPPLPFKAEFPNSAAFRDFLLAKCESFIYVKEFLIAFEVTITSNNKLIYKM